MDKTRKTLKTSLKHSESCIAVQNAILTTSIVMLPRFIVIPDNTYIRNISLSTKWPLLTTKKLKSRQESHRRWIYVLISYNTCQSFYFNLTFYIIRKLCNLLEKTIKFFFLNNILYFLFIFLTSNKLRDK